MSVGANEANFDGLVGPTHSYAGLSYGNIASMSHKAAVANPREAALQGLSKAKALADLGLLQGLIPPQERPDLPTLRRLGFSGSDSMVLESAAREAPELLAAACSASSMWTANAATVAPSADTLDGRVHFTSANLNQKFHRSIESATTARILKAIFPSEKHFAHHEALPHSDALGDEGAANHTRFCAEPGGPGVHLFVYGRVALDPGARVPKRFPARQTLEASRSVARLNRVRPEQVVYAQQNPEVIDSGAFHNDVVAVGNQEVLFFHERAFVDGNSIVRILSERVKSVCGCDLAVVRVADSDVPISDAVSSYLFNSQLITVARGHMVLVAPTECRDTESVRSYLDSLIGNGSCPIREVRHFDLRQSMNNGGGPACLRLRVVLTEQEWNHTNAGSKLNDLQYQKLKGWIERHYRDRLEPKDLADPQLILETRTALDELTRIMSLGSIYPFQVQS